MNVTVPYKEKVIPYLTGTDELAATIGAVNTLVRTQDGYVGYNTDMPGLYRAMQSDGIRIDGEEIILIGAGGVARAVAFMLAKKASHIYILNRKQHFYIRVKTITKCITINYSFTMSMFHYLKSAFALLIYT